jgi:thymidylate synthase
MKKSFDEQYIDLAKNILENGEWKENRTNHRTLSQIGGYLKIDCSESFPLLTTKKVFWKSAFAEMLGFIRGYDNAADFRKLGCNVWDKDANENIAWVNNPNRTGEDDLGRIYGKQSRTWNGYIDQLQCVINKLSNNIDDRRLLVLHWNPDELDEMALPPCHWAYQFGLRQNNSTIDLMLQMRSSDFFFFLGTPYNLSQYGFLLHIIARTTNKKVGNLHYSGFDIHIYEPHVPLVKKQINRLPIHKKPKIRFIGESEFLQGAEFWDFVNTTDIPLAEWVTIDDYNPHSAIRGEMYTETK